MKRKLANSFLHVSCLKIFKYPSTVFSLWWYADVFTSIAKTLKQQCAIFSRLILVPIFSWISIKMKICTLQGTVASLHVLAFVDIFYFPDKMLNIKFSHLLEIPKIELAQTNT